jgi:serine/threonine protein kinase
VDAGAPVAVKVLSGESTVDTFRAATRRLVTFAAVASPGLVPLYDAGQHDGVFYFSMRYLPGGSLATPADPVSPMAALRAVAGVARAAAALHAAGVVHGAIAPGNVLLDGDGPLLADPDLAQIFLPGVLSTGAGPLAAVEFRDPRRLLGEAPAPHHDVWSLGLLLHWALTGRARFDPAGAADGLAALRGVLAAAPELDPGCPPRLAELIAQCLGRPEERPDAAAVAERVADATGETGLIGASGAEATTPEPAVAP